MPSVEDRFSAAPAKCLIVFLPGVADRARSFADAGFIAALRRRNLSVDAVSADATLGYYLRGVQAVALEHDVVSSAASRGYSQVWMVGVSLGGFGALHYAAHFPARLDGVLALAPHQGEETSLQPIRDAGGLAAWQPSLPFESFTDETYAYFQKTLVSHRPGPQLWLGYGERDVVTGEPWLLADANQPERVLSDPGGHSWSTWSRLWERFLDESDLKERCAATPSLEASRRPTRASAAAAP